MLKEFLLMKEELSEMVSVRKIAMRFGTSSPKTREKYAITKVTNTIESVRAVLVDNPASINFGSTKTPSFSAPSAADRKPQTVTPTWAAARKRFGFCVNFATRAPLLP